MEKHVQQNSKYFLSTLIGRLWSCCINDKTNLAVDQKRESRRCNLKSTYQQRLHCQYKYICAQLVLNICNIHNGLQKNEQIKAIVRLIGVG